MQFAGNGLKRSARNGLVREPIELALLRRIDALALQLARLVACVARGTQRHQDLWRTGFCVVTERNALFLAAEAILPKPAA